MPGFFVDELLLIAPLRQSAGVRLYGEVVGAHKAPLTVAVTEHAQMTEEITVDLRRVDYLANSVLETFVALARHLNPPQCLCLVAGPELALAERLAQHGWDEIDTLRVATS
ncbi:hypothetical protein ACOKM5_39010 [Streptomyces sp. BH097]|uniref:hypothetical protein n=1 Tax=unclassified Streptomyces TaxID=2593676 RepID=UPI003BB75CF3